MPQQVTDFILIPATTPRPADGADVELPPGSRWYRRDTGTLRTLPSAPGQFHGGAFVPAAGSPNTATPVPLIVYASGGVPVTAPVVYPGYTLVDAFPDGVELLTNYVSTVGDVIEVVREVLLNGQPFISIAAYQDPLVATDVLRTRTRVTDSTGVVTYFPDPAGVAITITPLPVPVNTTAPAITGTARVGQTPTFTAAGWQATPGTPGGLTRTVVTRFTIAGVEVPTPLPPSALGQLVRVEQQARHVLNGVPGAFSSWVVSGTVTVQAVQTGGAVNPLLVLGAAVPGGNGEPDGALISNYAYTGPDIVDLHVVSGMTPGFAITAAQMKAGSGGAGVNFVTFPDFRLAPGQSITLTGFVNDSVQELAFLAAERNNGGVSLIGRLAVSGLDFTPPTASGWRTDATGSQVIGTLSEALLGDAVAANWTISGRTVTGIAIVGTTITLAVSPAVAHGNTVTVSHSGSNLRDSRGLPLAAISNAPVANNVPPPASTAPTWAFVDAWTQSTAIRTGGTVSQTSTAKIPGIGTYLLAIFSQNSADLVVDQAGAITRVVPLHNTQGDTYWVWIEANGAGDITVRNNSTSESTRRRLVLIDLDNATDLNHMEIPASGNQGAVTKAATLPQVPANYAVFSAVNLRSTGAGPVDATILGGLSDTDVLSEGYATGNTEVFGVVAAKVNPALGDVTTEFAVAGADAAWTWRISSIALAGA